ncbi:MAB_1171c family putative transporter [Streptomyces sp. NPDC048664]|uniref:MAB_1171c family putative transporter n=1 Tax=Streptomyces sp. NPDC048664 TaxID=3154505 RepID=UPI003449469F
MDGSSYYIPAAAMAFACAFKTPALIRSWRDPLLRSVCALLALTTLVFLFAAPPTIGNVNVLTGVTNASALLVYCLLSAFSAASLVVVVNWRGGPPAATRRVNRRIITGYAAVIVCLAVLFRLGDTPVERLRDFDTYYSETPFIREMIVLYLAAMTVAGLAMTLMCWRWALQVRAWLRAGLLIIVTGYLFNMAYLAAKFTAVIGHWAGLGLDGLSTDTAPALASVGAQISAVGFCLPLAGRRVSDSWTTWATYRRLGPLWRELRPVSAHAGSDVRISWWSSPQLQVTQRESDIHDGILTLFPYFDSVVRERTYDAAVAAGSDPVHARAEADAAMVAVALRARAADPEGRVVTSAEAGDTLATAHGSPRDLVRMSMALHRSPVVAAVWDQAGEQSR